MRCVLSDECGVEFSNTDSCGARLPADSFADEVDIAAATDFTSVTRAATTNGTVPSVAVGTVPSDDTVLSGDDMALDMSSQSVEIITNEESNLLDLDLQATLPPSDVTSRDLDPDVEGQFTTARFYIGESLPESPASESATTAGKVRHH